MMQWITLSNADQLNAIKKQSFEKPQVLFKHSTRCSVSSVALRRMEKSTQVPEADYYFLDLIRFRNISDRVAHDFDVYHESPQLLLIKNGECVYDESHMGINMQELAEQISSLN